MRKEYKEDQVCYVPTDLTGRSGGWLKALVLACLWSNPKINATGVTYDAVLVLSRYAGMEVAVIEAAIHDLEAGGEVKVDWAVGEVLVPRWLEFNYLQDRSVAAHPADVLRSLGEIKSEALRALLLKKIERLDVQYDAQTLA